MSEYDKAADVLFHAAMAVGASRKNSFFGATSDAIRYLYGGMDWETRKQAMWIYSNLHQHLGDAWPLHFSFHGGRWLTAAHMQELLLSILFAYEYAVQELGAARSSADPALLQVNFDVSALSLDYS